MTVSPEIETKQISTSAGWLKDQLQQHGHEKMLEPLVTLNGTRKQERQAG